MPNGSNYKNRTRITNGVAILLLVLSIIVLVFDGLLSTVDLPIIHILGILNSLCLATVLLSSKFDKSNSESSDRAENTICIEAGETPAISGENNSPKGSAVPCTTTSDSLAEEIDELRKRERAMIENAVDIICVINKEGKFISASPSAERAWGRSIQSLIGKSISEVVAAEDAEQTLQSLQQILGAQKSITKITFENRFVQQNGKISFWEWTAHWSASDDNLFCIAHDITDRKKTEKQLLETADQLRSAIEKMQEAERLRHEFVLMVNHDLRTPLTSLNELVKRIESDEFGHLSQSGKETCQDTRAELDRLLRLVGDLLDLDKIETVGLAIKKEKVSLLDVLEASVSSLKSYADANAIEILFPETESVLIGDRQRLIQVVINLLGNAIKFSPENSTVKILVQDDIDKSTISIVDKGPGITEAQAKQLFKRYQRLQNSDNVYRAGSGLGLAISKAIAEAHHGEIGCLPNSEGGSIFWFSIPNSVGDKLDTLDDAAVEL